MGPAFHVKVLGPGSHKYGPGSQVKSPRLRVPGPGSPVKVSDPWSCLGSRVPDPRWRVPGGGSRTLGPMYGFHVTSPGSRVPLFRYAVLWCSSNIKWDFSIVKIIAKVCVWYRCQNSRPALSPWWRTVKFFIKKYYISKHWLRKEEYFCDLCHVLQ